MCIAIIKVTYRNDQATDEPVLMPLYGIEGLPQAEVFDNCIEALKEDENVLRFTCFLYHSAYRREEVWAKNV